MKRLVLLSFCLTAAVALFAQPGQRSAEVPKVYRATPEKINDLVHTRLDARLDFPKSQLNGKVWISLKPHFYPTDSVSLDAKGMEIRQVAIVKNGKNTPLKYTYDGMVLNIDLDRTYRSNEQYTIYIDYLAKPNEFKAQGSSAITDAKGLYFINPLGQEKDKPTQVWTQGETEATSVWVPTIDKPNQKTTQEIMLTVPAKYVTLSNGKLASQKTNSDGTRTDHWKMDLPHAPYLFFIGAGDFAVVKDSYKGKEVSYYVDKEYGPVARKIFGLTPEMMGFFSRITGVEYPWVKYGQMTAHDYVSGAMENTTATLHSDVSQQDARQLTDGNTWEDVIAHELFHQWFGDLVTTESWSNLTLNESFANYSEYLWREYKYGKDHADAHNYDDMQGYLASRSEGKDLVRYHYRDKEDMFDAVSYNKGGRILHMLRNFVGDSAFFKAMNLYLTSNRFKSAEAHQLRLAFEEVTGKDLNWFWNQWYFGAGHPNLNITYNYNDAARQVSVIVEQTQQGDKVFVLPVKIDVWNGNTPVRHSVWVDSKIDTFTFSVPARPNLVNFDAEKILLANKEENKTLEEYVFQYNNARNYLDRREAIDAALAKQEQLAAAQMLVAATRDRYHGLRGYTVSQLDLSKDQIKTQAETSLQELAQKDPNRLVRAAAIAKLGNYRQAKYANIFRTAINDSSYTLAGNALEALNKIDTTAAFNEAKRLSAMPAKGRLENSIRSIMGSRDASAGYEMIKEFEAMPLGQEKLGKLEGLFEMLSATSNLDQFKKGVDAIFNFQNQIPEAFREQVAGALAVAFREMQKEKLLAGQKEQADYLETKLPKENK
ncbi:MAG TPA: M1 family metallopeptidase [Flavisolibacter sp.]|nr:M1 family metallopeptidase [Flavisolibacter sp.]